MVSLSASTEPHGQTAPSVLLAKYLPPTSPSTPPELGASSRPPQPSRPAPPTGNEKRRAGRTRAPDALRAYGFNPRGKNAGPQDPGSARGGVHVGVSAGVVRSGAVTLAYVPVATGITGEGLEALQYPLTGRNPAGAVRLGGHPHGSRCSARGRARGVALEEVRRGRAAAEEEVGKPLDGLREARAWPVIAASACSREAPPSPRNTGARPGRTPGPLLAWPRGR